MEDNLNIQNNKPKKVPILTIVAASLTSMTIICYAIFIIGYFYHIGTYPDLLIVSSIFIFPIISIATMVLAVKCARDKIKPFWIPNLILSFFFVIASFPTSCATTILSVSISVERQNKEKEEILRKEAKEIATIENMKSLLSTDYKSYYVKEIIDYFVSMEFTSTGDKTDVFQGHTKEFFSVSKSNETRFGVDFFYNYSGARVYCYRATSGWRSVGVQVVTYYSCEKEKATNLFKLIDEYKQKADHNYPSSLTSSVAFYL